MPAAKKSNQEEETKGPASGQGAPALSQESGDDGEDTVEGKDDGAKSFSSQEEVREGELGGHEGSSHRKEILGDAY